MRNGATATRRNGSESGVNADTRRDDVIDFSRIAFSPTHPRLATKSHRAKRKASEAEKNANIRTKLLELVFLRDSHRFDEVFDLSVKQEVRRQRCTCISCKRKGKKRDDEENKA
jgi:hypothetical protein